VHFENLSVDRIPALKMSKENLWSNRGIVMFDLEKPIYFTSFFALPYISHFSTGKPEVILKLGHFLEYTGFKIK